VSRVGIDEIHFFEYWVGEGARFKAPDVTMVIDSLSTYLLDCGLLNFTAIGSYKNAINVDRCTRMCRSVITHVLVHKLLNIKYEQFEV